MGCPLSLKPECAASTSRACSSRRARRRLRFCHGRGRPGRDRPAHHRQERGPDRRGRELAARARRRLGRRGPRARVVDVLLDFNVGASAAERLERASSRDRAWISKNAGPPYRSVPAYDAIRVRRALRASSFHVTMPRSTARARRAARRRREGRPGGRGARATTSSPALRIHSRRASADEARSARQLRRRGVGAGRGRRTAPALAQHRRRSGGGVRGEPRGLARGRRRGRAAARLRSRSATDGSLEHLRLGGDQARARRSFEPQLLLDKKTQDTGRYAIAFSTWSTRLAARARSGAHSSWRRRAVFQNPADVPATVRGRGRAAHAACSRS